MAEAIEFKQTPPEEQLRDSLERDGLKYKNLLTQWMKENKHLFINTGQWDTGIVMNEGTPEQRFELKPILELEDEGEGSQLYYFLTEEGIFLTGQAIVGGYGYQPIWDEDVKEINISEYPSHAAWALREMQNRQERFEFSKSK